MTSGPRAKSRPKGQPPQRGNGAGASSARGRRNCRPPLQRHPVGSLSGEIEALARQDQACSRLMTVPGIGPIISSAMVAAIGTGDVFSKGRDFGAWLGLVPKQISTGDRTILGKISRRGNRYLRVLFWDVRSKSVLHSTSDIMARMKDQVSVGFTGAARNRNIRGSTRIS